jgi:hypothetical protein
MDFLKHYCALRKNFTNTNVASLFWILLLLPGINFSPLAGKIIVARSNIIEDPLTLKKTTA